MSISTELEVLKDSVAKQQEQLQQCYIRVKELNEELKKESAERRLLGLSGCPHCGK